MRILIIGAGGHGRVVADAILQCQAHGSPVQVVGFLDDDGTRAGMTWLQIPVLGTLSAIDTVPHDAVVVAIGDNATRRRLAHTAAVASRPHVVVRHPTAIVAPEVTLGDGSMVSAGAIIATGAGVGRSCIVNTGCVIDHDCRIGDWAHVAPRAVLGGDVTVGSLAFIGIGATVLPGRHIGEAAIVGAGAVVTNDVAPGTVVTGVPARVRPSRA